MELVKQVLAHPLISGAITALALGTALTVGAIMEVGVALLPLINKADLLALLAFYAAAGSILFRVVSLYWQLFSRSGWGKRVAATVRLPRPGYMTVIVFILVAVIAGVTTLLLFGEVVRGRRIALISGAITTAFMAYLLTSDKEAVRASRLYGLQIFALLTAFFAGGAWIEHLRVAGPVVELQRASGPLEEATIVMTASEGLLVYLRKDLAVQYVPWSQLTGIRPLPATP
jgi:hypothetical protein